MLENPTEAPQRGVGTGPDLECGCHRRDHLIQSCEIAVVKTAPPSQLPDPFDRIEFRTVGRQEVQAKMIRDLSSPSHMQVGMVIASVVEDHHHFPAWATAALQFPVKIPAGAGVKHTVGPGQDQLAISEAYGPEKADALSRRRMQANRIGYLGRNPHTATRAMLLEMNFIHGPQINVVSSRQCAEFFYAWLARADRLAPLAGAACAIESPIGGTTADTGALLISHPVPGSETPTAWGRPTFGCSARMFWEWCARPLQRRPVAFRSSGWGVRAADLRPARPTPRFQTAAPSLQRYGGNHPAVGQRVGRSHLEPRAKRRGDDGHSGRRRCAESHPEWP
jgi:hypothetical protein